MMDLVDTHCHIQSIGVTAGERATRELWAGDSEITAETVIENANKHGVTRLLCVGCEYKDSQLAIEFASSREGCWATIGIHPHEAREYTGKDELLNNFAELVNKPKVVAIGECGLDFYYTHSPKNEQIELLKFQIELATAHDLPLIFHVREAFDDFWPILDSYSKVRGVLHSFTDSVENLGEGLKRGLYIGVNGIATFTKSDAQKEVYKAIPLNNLLLETDSPFLTPAPYRGKVNQPMRVGVVADYLANLRAESREDLARITTANARKLFGI